uniref:AMP-dependent synthetase/ligase domain-containing protein n=1 Tax=Biomphalaria glabrata TaxID=6526 RepID=A0A2C9L053_BIOGL
MSSTVAKELCNVCLNYPDREAVISYDLTMTRQSITFRQLWQLASRFAHVLKSAGVRQGEYVLVTTPLSIEFWVASLGVILTGAVHISTEKFYSGGEIITEVVNMSKARYIVLSGDQGSEMWDMFKNDAKPVAGSTFVTSVCCRSMPTLEKLVLTNKSSESKGANFLEVLASLSEEFCNPDIQPEDGAAVVLSIDKDKANRPKMCEISHAAIAAYSKVFWKKFPDVFKKEDEADTREDEADTREDEADTREDETDTREDETDTREDETDCQHDVCDDWLKLILKAENG